MRSITSLLDIALPIIQAPMAGSQDEALALAVAAAGGLGSMPCALLDASRLEAALQRFASVSQPINLNFFCHQMNDPDVNEAERWQQTLAPYYREFGIEPPRLSTAGARRPLDLATLDRLEAFRPRVMSFHFGLPEAALLERIKAWGTKVMASATTLDEGNWLERRGADIVIAHGIEAGGHRGHFLSDDLSLQRSTIELVAALAKRLTIPVVAAGGIGSRQDVERCIAAGASAVQVGTAYLLCPEAKTSAVHRAALQEAHRPAAITNLFSGRPARGLVNRLMRDLGSLSEQAPTFPWASQALAPLRAAAEARGLDDFSPLWAGTKPNAFAGLSAAEITKRLAS